MCVNVCVFLCVSTFLKELMFLKVERTLAIIRPSAVKQHREAILETIKWVVCFGCLVCTKIRGRVDKFGAIIDSYTSQNATPAFFFFRESGFEIALQKEMQLTREQVSAALDYRSNHRAKGAPVILNQCLSPISNTNPPYIGCPKKNCLLYFRH